MELVTPEKIPQMSLAEARALAKEHGVPLAKCKSIDDFRDRLLLHRNKIRKGNFDIEHEFVGLRGESSDSMELTMKQLLAAVQDALVGLHGDVIASLEEALHPQSIGSSNNNDRPHLHVLSELETRKNKLAKSQCSVIVAGETNAGKSTLLNLMLGMEILPTSILSCTAVVCTLRYASDYSADTVYEDGRVEHRDFTDLQDARRNLEGTAAESDHTRREHRSGVKRVDIYLPAAILKSGVTLVDTPGIGENDVMDRCTMEYVQQHSASAYIYVVKTDNAGGVQDDKLLEFLRSILRYYKMTDGLDVFDPSSAIFVCNRWDQISKDQRSRVQENAEQKLKDVWPNFDPNQAFFISTTTALMHWEVDHAYFTDEYEMLLKGVKELFAKAQQNTANHDYRWLKHMLHICTNLLQMTISHCSLSNEALQARFKSTAEKLAALQSKASETTSLLRRQLEEEALNLCHIMADILREPETLKELDEWDLSTVPPPPKIGTGQTDRWVEEVDTMVMRRIVDVVDARVERRQVAKNMERAFKVRAQDHLLLLDDEMDSIASDMRDNASLNSSVCSSLAGASSSSDDDLSEELLHLYRHRPHGRRGEGVTRFRQLHSFSRVAAKKNSVAFGGSMIALPKVTLRNLLRSVLRPLADLMAKTRMRRRSSAFTASPEAYLRDRVHKLAAVVRDNEQCLLQMVVKYRVRLDALITDIDNSIPRFVTLYKQIMEDTRTNHRKLQSQRCDLIEVMEKLEPVRDLLRGFGSLYIRDVTADNIDFSLDKNSRRASIQVSLNEHLSVSPGDSGYNNSLTCVPRSLVTSGTCQALWYIFRTGKVEIGDTKEQVMGRSYFHSPPEAELIKEIARLRCLKSDFVASFFGVTRMYNPPAFLFTGDLMSARSFLSHGFHNPPDSVPTILEGTLRGLDYLHREGLVHMELTLDTLTVARDGEPRLCGGCLPRRARFPPDADTVRAKPFFCLSPEVLHHEIYTPDDDVYSFGLIVMETCLKLEPYAGQRSLSLGEFQHSVHPASMLALEGLGLSDVMTAILRGSLLPARGLRIRMWELRGYVSQIKSDPAVLSLSSCERRQKHKALPKSRRGSCDESRLQLNGVPVGVTLRKLSQE